MTKEEAIKRLKEIDIRDALQEDYDALYMAIKALEYDDAKYHEEHGEVIVDKGLWEDAKKALEQEPKTDKYEYHTDHTDCIWYGNDSGCPTTCSQYRDGWNDAMEYVYKNGKGYQPYRSEG